MEPTPPPEDVSTVEVGGLQLRPGDRIGPYVYRRPIGKGGMAHVLLGIDPDGNPVALKVLKSNRINTGLTRFKREFRALARLRHPNVIRVDAYGDLHGHPYIAMEYVEGTDLHQEIQRFRTMRPEEKYRRIEEVLVDLARALAYIHRRGLIHRDLKPSNVLIDTEDRCKLTDFGIVKDLDPNADTAISTTLVGTWAYASPEQINGLPIDHRSDLYSLGVILFAMLTGRRPFVAKDLAGYLELHRSHRAPAPRTIDTRIPPHLDDICLRLLRKNPRDRFRSAQEILYRLEQLDTVAEVDGGAFVPPFVGRAAEEADIVEAVAALTAGRGGLVLLEGDEGSGKSRLLDQLVLHAQIVGLVVVQDRVRPREVPGTPMVRIARRFAQELGALAPATLAPAVAAFADEGRSPAGNARERLVDALSDALGGLLDGGPVVLVVDDLHEAQGPTLDGLTTLVRRWLVTEPRPFLLAAAYRGDRVPPRLHALAHGAGGIPARRLLLKPLDSEALGTLAETLLGPGRPALALAERLLRETDGNPLFVTLFLQHLMGQGLLARVGTGWRLTADVDEIVSGHLDIPPGVRQVVRARLQPLDPDQRELVEAIAVYGREVDLDLLLDVLDIDEDVVGELVEGLDELGILRQRRVGEQVTIDFTHSKYADVLYRELHLERRAELHRRIAAVLEVRHGSESAAAEMIGEHYRRAGEAGKSWQYLVAAARRLRDRGLPNEAWDLAQRAALVEDAARVDLDPTTFVQVRRSLLAVRADVLQLRGEWADAREALDHIVAMAPAGEEDPETLAARLQLARVLRALGDLDGAEREASTALLVARERHDRALIADGLLALSGVAWDRGDLDTAEARAQEGLAGATGPGLTPARANLLLAHTAVLAARGMLASAASGLAEAQLLLKDLGLHSLRAIALANLAEVLLLQGDLGGALQQATDAHAEALAAGHRVGEIVARTVRGAVAMAAAAPADARIDLDAALAAARTLAVPSETVLPLLHLARLAIDADDARGALKLLDQADLALRTGDPERMRYASVALRALAFARNGSAPMAAKLLTEVEAALPSLPVYRRVQVLLDVAAARLALGARPAAAELYRSASQFASLRGFRLAMLEALRGVSHAAEEEDTRRRAASDLAPWVEEVSASVPLRWRSGFLARFG
jgi:tetratricopeptide (TPR) repeat protein